MTAAVSSLRLELTPGTSVFHNASLSSKHQGLQARGRPVKPSASGYNAARLKPPRPPPGFTRAEPKTSWPPSWTTRRRRVSTPKAPSSTLRPSCLPGGVRGRTAGAARLLSSVLLVPTSRAACRAWAIWVMRVSPRHPGGTGSASAGGNEWLPERPRSRLWEAKGLLPGLLPGHLSEATLLRELGGMNMLSPADGTICTPNSPASFLRWHPVAILACCT